MRSKIAIGVVAALISLQAVAAPQWGNQPQPQPRAWGEGVPQEMAVNIVPVSDTTYKTECTQGQSAQQPSILGGITAPILGGLAGAGLGSQIGKGRGNAAATAGMAVIGSQIGEAVNRESQPQATPPACRQVGERRLVGYELQGDRGTRMFVSIDLVNGYGR